MHRSSFRRGGAGAFKLDLPKMEMPQHQGRQEQNMNNVGVGGGAMSRALNHVISQFEDSLVAQLIMLNRLEESVVRLRDATVALNDRLDDKTSELNKQVSDLKSGLISVGSALKTHVETVSNQLHGSLNPKGDFAAIRSELAKLNDILGGLKNHEKMMSRMEMEGSERKRGSEMRGSAILSALNEVSDKLDSLAKQPKPGKGKQVDKSVLGEIMSMIRAEKKVVRDQDGNITGWKLARTVN